MPGRSTAPMLVRRSSIRVSLRRSAGPRRGDRPRLPRLSPSFRPTLSNRAQWRSLYGQRNRRLCDRLASRVAAAFDRTLRERCWPANVEQELAPNLTAFGRFGWNNDKTESFAFTEVGQSLAGGVGANGAMWHRRQDRAGLAFVSNAISKDHQNYLALGGHGFLLGDGALHYGRENIIETYYTVHVWSGIYAAPGLQYIVNPGYNRDRSPVLVPSFRLHLEF